MLKRFFFSVLSSFVGAWMAIVLSGLVIALAVIAMFAGSFGSSFARIEDDSVLRVYLFGTIVERTPSKTLELEDLLSDNQEVINSLDNLLVSIDEATENDKIRAIYLDCGDLTAGPASLNQLRNSLIEFKKSGKKIFAYADQMSQGAYYVASVADEICLNPAGEVELSGLGGETMFYKGLFDKLGIEFEVVRVGEGKSAVEPYVCTEMSDYARNQTMSLLNNLWNTVRSGMATSRKLKSSDIDSLINKDFIKCKSAQFAKKANLVDCIDYRHKFESKIAQHVGQGDKLETFVTPDDVVIANGMNNLIADVTDDHIAVVYACGGIDNSFDGSGIISSELVDVILDLAERDEVKGMVLRVNSPGGSAFGSEQIWEALETFKSKGKPLAVSMGDYAASGGYYISCGANRIFADSLTITGSIGIFGLIPNVDGLMENVGLNTELVATNPDGVFPSVFKPMTPEQQQAMQSMVEDGYNLFVSRCAQGRKVTKDKIEAIADGRPISGLEAKKLGLIDEIGSLQQAVEWTAKRAKMEDYAVVSYPELRPSFFAMLSTFSSMSQYMSSLSDLNENWPEKAREITKRILGTDKVQALMPPVRVKI